MAQLSIDYPNSPYRHAVALIIKPIKKEIFYQDPMGKGMSAAFRDAMARHFPEYKINEPQLRQQHDITSCSVIVTDLLLRYMEGKRDLRLGIDTKALREEHAAIVTPHPRTGVPMP